MKYIKSAGLPMLSVFLTCLFPCIFLFCVNADEAKFHHMFPFFVVFLITAALFLLPLWLFLKDWACAAVVTDAAMLAVINFTMVCNGIKKLLPGFRNKLLLLLLIAALLGLILLLRKKRPQLQAVTGIISLTFGVLCVMNLFTAIPTLVSQVTYSPPKTELGQQISELKFQREQPNVYYFIFDEYGGSENLMHYLDYDNEEFLSALEARGFSVSRSSRNPESPWTVTLVPNILNLSYVADESQPINNRLEWLKNPVLYQLFRENGYVINLINQNNFLDDTGCNLLSSGQREETISDYLYENSIFVQLPWLKWKIEKLVLGREPNSKYTTMQNIRTALELCHEHVGQQPTLTVAYVVSPHDPFVCDRNGDPLPEETYTCWTTTDYYYEKLLYTNDMILTAVDRILESDPDAVILLQSDHGSRQPGHLVNQFDGPWFDQSVENPMMASVLNCVRVPNGQVDIEGDTCINTSRKVLRHTFGIDLEPLDVPPIYTIPDEDMPEPPAPETKVPQENVSDSDMKDNSGNKGKAEPKGDPGNKGKDELKDDSEKNDESDAKNEHNDISDQGMPHSRQEVNHP